MTQIQTRYNGRFHWFGRVTSMLIGALAMAAMVGAPGCSASSSSAPADPGDHATSHRDAVVDGLAARLPDLLRSVARRRATGPTIDAVLANPDDTLDEVQLHDADAVRRLYDRRDHRLLWVRADQSTITWTPAGHDLIAGLRRAVTRHAMWPTQLHLPWVDDAHIVADPERAGQPFAGVVLETAERDKIGQWLAGQPRSYTVDENLVDLTDRLVAKGQPLDRLRAAVDEQVRRDGDAAGRASRVDVVLSDALVRYAAKMRLDNPAWQKHRIWPARLQAADASSEADHGAKTSNSSADADPGSDADTDQRLSGDALEQARRSLVVDQRLGPVFDTPSTVAQAMADLVVPFEPYRRLATAFERYADLVDAGGWPEIGDKAAKLRRGDSDNVVPTIKRRLSIEGYFDGDDSETFGDDLRRAIVDYQSTHQLWEHGWLTAQTLRSLNVSAERRRAQIRLTLQRWRASRIGSDRHYVHVNLADFHGSVWRDGQRKMYFKVIVGRSDHEQNDDGELVYPHATPRFSDRIEYIVFNPYWNVPDSIRTGEVEPAAAQEPGYLAKKGYEYAIDEHGNRFLRQKPGPDNALGSMKFLFPNRHSVYLHDTPATYLFDNPVRAYSHGCVRMEHPMKFANYLLDLDGRWMGKKRKKQLEKWLNKDGEKWVNLRTELPVHLEYYVVRVDDDGRTNFLADLYGLDRPRLQQIADHGAH